MPADPGVKHITGSGFPGTLGRSSQLCLLALLGYPDSVWLLGSRETHRVVNTSKPSHKTGYDHLALPAQLRMRNEKET